MADEFTQASELFFEDPTTLLYSPFLFDGVIDDYLSKTVKYDLVAKPLLLFTGLSAYWAKAEEKPLNVFMKGPPAIGKTYVTVEVFKLFPQGDVWFMQDMTPKAVVNQLGVRIGKDGSRVKKLDVDGKQKKMRDIQEETDHILISNVGRIFVFLDSPREDTMAFLLPMLSHDRWEMDYPTVSSDTRLTERMRIRGWPAVVSCTMDPTPFEALATRGVTYTPERNLKKLEAAIKLQGDRVSQPWIYDEEYDPELAAIRAAIERIKNFFLRAEMRFVCPFGNQVAKIFPVRRPRDMRDHPTLQKLMKSSAALDVLQRVWIHFQSKEKGSPNWVTERTYVCENGTDYERGRMLYNAVVEATKADLTQEMIDFYVLAIKGIEKQRYGDLQAAIWEWKKETKGQNRIWEDLLSPLRSEGWVNLEKDQDDGRFKLVLDAKTDGEYVDYVATEFPGLFSEKDFGEWYFGLQKYISRDRARGTSWRAKIRLPTATQSVDVDAELATLKTADKVDYRELFRFISDRYISDTLKRAERASADRSSLENMSRRIRHNFRERNQEKHPDWQIDGKRLSGGGQTDLDGCDRCAAGEHNSCTRASEAGCCCGTLLVFGFEGGR